MADLYDDLEDAEDAIKSLGKDTEDIARNLEKIVGKINTTTNKLEDSSGRVLDATRATIIAAEKNLDIEKEIEGSKSRQKILVDKIGQKARESFSQYRSLSTMKRELAELKRATASSITSTGDMTQDIVNAQRRVRMEERIDQLTRSILEKEARISEMRADPERRSLQDTLQREKSNYRILGMFNQMANIGGRAGRTALSARSSTKYIKEMMDAVLKGTGPLAAGLDKAKSALGRILVLLAAGKIGPAAALLMLGSQLSKAFSMAFSRIGMGIQGLILAAKRFYELDKAAEEFRTTTGLARDQMEYLETQARTINVNFREFGVTAKEAYSSIASLVEEFQTADFVLQNEAETVALMKANLSVAEKDSAKVMMYFKGMNIPAGRTAKDMVMIATHMAKTANVPVAKVMKDLAAASNETLALIGMMPEKLAKAAVSARRIGSDLESVSKSASGFLNFQESISLEMEASAMLGKSLNFQLAREYALNGDIVNARKAAFEEIKRAGDFENMSYYQRNALAKAGMMDIQEILKMRSQEKQFDEVKLYGSEKQKRLLNNYLDGQKELNKLSEEERRKKSIEDATSFIRTQQRQGKISEMTSKLGKITDRIGDSLSDIMVPLVNIAIALLDKLVDRVEEFSLKMRAGMEPVSIFVKAQQEGKGFFESAELARKSYMQIVEEEAEAIAAREKREQRNNGSQPNSRQGMIRAPRLVETKDTSIVNELVANRFLTFGTLIASSQIMALGSLARKARTIATIASLPGATKFFNGLEKFSTILPRIGNSIKSTRYISSFISTFPKIAGTIGRVASFILPIASRLGPFGKFIPYVGVIFLAIDAIKSIFGIVEDFSTIWSSKESTLSKLGRSVGAIIGNLFDGFISPLIKLVTFGKLDINARSLFTDGLKTTEREIPQTVAAAFDGATKQYEESAWAAASPSDIGLNMVKGIESAAPKMTNALTFPFQDATARIKNEMNRIPNILNGTVARMENASDVSYKYEGNRVTNADENYNKLIQGINDLRAALDKSFNENGTQRMAEQLGQLISMMKDGAVVATVDLNRLHQKLTNGS